MEIRIDAKEIKLYVVNGYVGNIEIPNHTIYDGPCTFGRKVVVEFCDCEGICKKVDISAIVRDTQNHLNEQLNQSEELAKKYNKPSDRYIIKDMWVKKIFICNNTIYIEFWWKDYIASTRCYISKEYIIKSGIDKDSFLASYKNPRFYF